MGSNSPLMMLVVAFATFLASSGGFWVYLKSRIEAQHKEQSATNRLLLGMARDRILSLGFKYVDRGWLTHDEYQNLKKYLYEPYAELGGNGTVERLMDVIDGLPFRPGPSYMMTSEDKREAAASATKIASKEFDLP